MRKKTIRKVFSLAVIFIVCALVSVLFAYNKALNSVNFEGESEKIITIPKGVSVEKITEILTENRIVEEPFWFKFAVKLSESQSKLKAGVFKFKQGKTNKELIDLLVDGKQVLKKITIPEGLTYKEIAEIFSREFSFNSGEFVRLCEDVEFLEELEIKQSSVEGYLLPETYFFPPSLTEKEAIKFLVSSFNDFWEENFPHGKTDTTVVLNRNQLLTLASLVEGEAILDEERAKIASVYLNRLKKGMKLQADPTVQYLLEGKPRRLLFKDLEIDSPYNTYLYEGLPPAPINNPGKKSILASLNPAEVSYLFFVAVGNGSHTFSNNFNEHLQAKSKFDKVRREVSRANSKNL
ncbi:endolytic transglycosylase MltG [bacterium]|nr:endolytic transglycosylase MltG [bacterium]